MRPRRPPHAATERMSLPSSTRQTSCEVLHATLTSALQQNSGWFPVVCFDRVDLHAVGVTSVTTSENTQALGRRSCNRRGDGILCCYSLLSSLHFHLLPLVICHIVIVHTYLALRIWDFCRLLCLHRLPLLDLAHIDWRQSEIEGSLRRKQRQRTVAGTCSVPSSQ